MTLSIYKYPIVGGQSVFLPANVQILHVGLDPKDVLSLWVLGDPDTKLEERRFFVYGTGYSVSGPLVHIATVRNGICMDHVFMEYNAPSRLLL